MLDCRMSLEKGKDAQIKRFTGGNANLRWVDKLRQRNGDCDDDVRSRKEREKQTNGR